MIFGITMGDSSGIGPEVLLRAWQKGQIRHPVVVYGGLDVLAFCNEYLGYGVQLRGIAAPAEHSSGSLNVLDLGMLRREDLAIGRISAKSGAAAREYVVAATRDALEIGRAHV